MRTKPQYNTRTKPQQNEDNASNTSGGTKPHTEKKIRMLFLSEINLIFITRIPRGIYIILGGFVKNCIFPTSGRHLQTSAPNILYPL